MDHQWRPILPPEGNICPICSAPHFPFCPPQTLPPYPTYNQNPRFPPHPNYPPHDPYHAGMPNQYVDNPNDGWHRNQSFDYRGGFGLSVYDYNNNNSNSSSNGYIGEVDGRFKRPRVDEVGSTLYGHDNNQNPANFLSEDERRLKLIRDHGVALSGDLTNVSYGSDFNASYGRNVDMNNHFECSRNGEPNRLQNDGSAMYSPFHPNARMQQSRESQSLPYRVPEVRNAHYGDLSLAQNQFNESMSAKGPHYSHMSNWQENQPSQSYGMPNYLRPDYQTPGHGMNEPGGYLPCPENRVIGGQPPPPPLPASPPPPVPMERFKAYSSPPKTSLFPVPISSSASNSYLQNKPLSHASTAFSSEEWQTSSLPKQLSPDKPTIIDASQLFKQPYRAARPDHIVIILRGLPGSGKSYLAKMMRDLEVENGGNAPRIHSMDDYFMTEVEKVEDSDASKSSSLGRGKKLTMKKVMEYCYEPEMEEAYRDSMLKAFKKTLEEGIFTLVIVDDRNLRVADFAQFWAIAKRSGYEVYISEAPYKDPVGCAARNVHGFTLTEIKDMARQWEEAPALYLQLDIKSLFHGDDLKESGIQEVDMDTEDDDNPPGLLERNTEKAIPELLEDNLPQVPPKDGKRWDAEEDHSAQGVKELGKSKWSDDLDEDDTEGYERMKGNLNALSGLIQAYGKQGKSVRWSDQVGNTGFSIGAAKANVRSLVIGPGAGYNLKSNPLPKDGSLTSTHSMGESRRQSTFQERLRAEHESFKAVFDKRRRRIGGLDLEEE
ncbi:hypothetical protein P3X46_023296 [Hevea brasiliensis]|uniref:YLP motif-containing protein 1 n=1 Tax=Hevea brasiliensis TaxID=3981 RepID=A0ABQ9LCF4_HEVBR|nr:uncharacterized protein LOC110645860 isoform X2 [Hevea brasiliensis]KAJ9163651.1 hypothetical protein P3X46_023296 [Hevea brasiliensis]